MPTLLQKRYERYTMAIEAIQLLCDMDNEKNILTPTLVYLREQKKITGETIIDEFNLLSIQVDSPIIINPEN
jgi:hypothetical protein